MNILNIFNSRYVLCTNNYNNNNNKKKEESCSTILMALARITLNANPFSAAGFPWEANQ